jgi:hypothetical protein
MDRNITINGNPLHVFLQDVRRREVTEHIRREQVLLGRICGLRRATTAPTLRAGRRGRPKRAFDVVLQAELEPYLRDDSCPFSGISDLFEMSVNVLRAYANRLGITRKRGRKPGYKRSLPQVGVMAEAGR